jgi:uncharacterized membrane protein (DUF106 family)
MDLLTRIVVWLNGLANALGGVLLAPIGMLPGWLSATLVAAVTGILLLVAFKYTSNQRAIKRAKDDIKANLLALKLFKESASVALRAQGSILRSALRLMVLAIVPMLVMVVPVVLFMGQLSLWYQARPLDVHEEAIVTLKLGEVGAPRPDVQLQPNDAVEVTVGPVRVPSQHEVCWRIKAEKPGHHRLLFCVGDNTAEKDLVAGDRFMRVSSLRPDWNAADALLYPAEKPFDRDSPIQSIAIDYPTRPGWTSGSDWWVFYWFAVSMVFGFAFRGVFNVNM